MAAPSITGTSSANGFTSSSSYTLSHTHPNTGINQGLIVVTTSYGTDTPPTSVTWNGTNMINLINFGGLGVCGTTWWFLAAPAIGTFNVVANISPSRAGNMQVFSLQDVLQTSPLDVSARAGGGGLTTISQSVTTTANNELVLSSLAKNNSATPTYSGVQTAIANCFDTASTYLWSTYSTKTTAGSETHSYTWSGATACDETMIALKGVASSAVNHGISPAFL